LTYNDCKFRHCFQAVTVGTAVNLSNCQFIHNEVGVYGWAYYTINNCLFKDNNTSIYAYASAFDMRNTSFIDNTVGVSFLSNAVDSIVISDCSFLNNELALNYPNNGKVYNCLFSDNTTALGNAYDCEIFDNQFIYNELALDASVKADIHNNQINQNFGGVQISYVFNAADSPFIYDNEICNNINFSVSNNTNMNYSLLENCFCGLDSTEIELSIIDGYDDITKGLINYDVYDSTCTTVTSSVIKFSQQPASIDETNETIFSVVNPFTNELAITFKDAKEHVIVIETFDGKLLYSGVTTGLVLPTVNWSTGTYYISIDQKNHKQLIKL
jgi:hypothetical protein